MTAIILAGGKSFRMGFDKAFIRRIGGVALVKRQIQLLQSFFKVNMSAWMGRILPMPR